MVQYRQSGTEHVFGTDVTIPANELGHELTGLTADATYDVSLLANTENGEIVFLADNAVIPSVLPPPKNIRVRTITDRTVHLTWESSHSDVDRYMLRLENQLRDDQIQTELTSNTNFLFNNLRPDTEYIVEVFSMISSKQLTSNESRNVNFRTNTPRQLEAPRNLRQTSQTSFSITVQWEMPRDVNNVHLRLLAGMRPVEEFDSKSNQHTFSMLETSRQYKLVVFSSENMAKSPPIELFVHTAPLLPVNISPSSPSSDEIIVGWQNGPYPGDI